MTSQQTQPQAMNRTISELPDSILRKIFLLLPTPKIAECALVCQRWSRVIRDYEVLVDSIFHGIRYLSVDQKMRSDDIRRISAQASEIRRGIASKITKISSLWSNHRFGHYQCSQDYIMYLSELVSVRPRIATKRREGFAAMSFDAITVPSGVTTVQQTGDGATIVLALADGQIAEYDFPNRALRTTYPNHSDVAHICADTGGDLLLTESHEVPMIKISRLTSGDQLYCSNNFTFTSRNNWVKLRSVIWRSGTASRLVVMKVETDGLAYELDVYTLDSMEQGITVVYSCDGIMPRRPRRKMFCGPQVIQGVGVFWNQVDHDGYYQLCRLSEADGQLHRDVLRIPDAGRSLHLLAGGRKFLVATVARRSFLSGPASVVIYAILGSELKSISQIPAPWHCLPACSPNWLDGLDGTSPLRPIHIVGREQSVSMLVLFMYVGLVAALVVYVMWPDFRNVAIAVGVTTASSIILSKVLSLMIETYV